MSMSEMVKKNLYLTLSDYSSITKQWRNEVNNSEFLDIPKNFKWILKWKMIGFILMFLCRNIVCVGWKLLIRKSFQNFNTKIHSKRIPNILFYHHHHHHRHKKVNMNQLPLAMLMKDERKRGTNGSILWKKNK